MSWMVGDKPLDLETGRAFGCRVAWVGPKAWRSRFREAAREWHPDVVADDLIHAAKAIVRRGPAHDPRGARDKVIA